MEHYKLSSLLFIAGNVLANNAQEEGRIIRKLFESYDPSLRPSANQGEAKVSYLLLLFSILRWGS